MAINASGGVQSSLTQGPGSTGNPSYNYTFVVQVPIPFLNLNLNLNTAAAFVLAEFTGVKVPAAMMSFISGAEAIIQNIINDAIILVKAIPEASVIILVKVGMVTIVNVQLVAERVPFVVPIPKFQLSDFFIAGNFSPKIPFPPAQATVIYVPIPVPELYFAPALATGQPAGSSTVPVENRLYLPKI
jgi:hypothetical protein